MGEKRIKFPEGGLKAANEMWEYLKGRIMLSPEQKLAFCVEAALRWLIDQEITEEQAKAITAAIEGDPYEWDMVRQGIKEWLRRMFLAPEPEIPEEIEDLLWRKDLTEPEMLLRDFTDRINFSIAEGYRRGQKSKEGR